MSDQQISGAADQGADFLLELRSEEIPARMQAGARTELEKLFRAQMAAAGLQVGEIQLWSTPRRLALIAKNLPLGTAAVSEELKGPRSSAPPQALEGFLRKTGLTQDQLEDRDGVYFAVINKPGRDTKSVLAQAVPAIIRAFSWPKSMRWGQASGSSDSLRWVRPLSGIIALLGDELVECDINGVASSNQTLGHRFHSDGEISIANAGEYAAKLREAFVIIDHEERQAIIREGAAKAAADAGLVLVADEALVFENAGLTEWPLPLLGRFDEEFLAVPSEVIQLTARVNQKYFVVTHADGKLANGFICTANIAAHDGGKAIVAGNEKVLAARLADARFFWEQDQKKPLTDHAKMLSNISFHEKLGSVAQRQARFAALADQFQGQLADSVPAAKQAAAILKSDLVTEMVGEFPELQGLMGGYYAAAEGLGDDVAAAIRDHYKPASQSDDLPSVNAAILTALMDKIDALVGFYGVGLKPTGSKDPFALRRAALGVIRLITEKGLRLQLKPLFDAAAQLYRDQSIAVADSSDDLLHFFADRLKVQQREAGVRHDLIDAVLALGEEDDLVRLLDRVKALQSFAETEDGANLLAGYKRAANILKQAGEYSEQPLKEAPTPVDIALDEALRKAEPAAGAAIENERFTDAMTALSSLRAPIDAFFDAVMVNDPDAAVRAYRLGLLSRFTAAVHGVADFSKIEG